VVIFTESHEVLFKGLCCSVPLCKMREGICTQAKLHAVHLQKQDIVQNIKQRKDTTTVLWV